MSAPSVVAVVPARDEASTLAATIAALTALPEVSAVVVCDDGSRDDTRGVAHASGAVVASHPKPRGKAAAMATGAEAATRAGLDPGAVLFVDADLGATAAAAAALIAPIVDDTADMTIAVPPPLEPGQVAGFGLVKGLARDGIRRATGLQVRAPLSGQRCLSAAALRAATPFAAGWGVEVAMTIDVARAGLCVREVDVAFTHRVTGRDLRAQLHRAAQFRDVARALAARGVLPRPGPSGSPA